jgi:16S rRNA (uracil1498-N3)-methyltransferase
MKKKTLPRFFVPDLDAARQYAPLPADEAEHLTRVLRARAGDEIAVFDGRGREFAARVAAVSRRNVSIELLGPIAPADECAVSVTLAQAVLKGDKMDDVIRDAVMLGAARIVPLITDHIAVRLSTIEAGKPADRWSRVALASTKQCGRATLAAVDAPVPFATFLTSSPAPLTLLFVEPSASGSPTSLRSFIGKPAPSSVAVLVGPEGGWSEQEHHAAVAAGCTPVTLGNLTLRADAVAVAAIAVVRFLWE